MNYFGYMPNDFINGEGVCVSLWTAGCPHHCPGCHNSQMWDEKNGVLIPSDIRGRIIKPISQNGIQRNLSILGGEPLSYYNVNFVEDIVQAIRVAYPNIKIFIWTGYTLEELKYRIDQGEDQLKHILSNIDVLIDGRYIEKERDITLPLRGSKNQRVLRKNIDF